MRIILEHRTGEDTARVAGMIAALQEYAATLDVPTTVEARAVVNGFEFKNMAFSDGPIETAGIAMRAEPEARI